MAKQKPQFTSQSKMTVMVFQFEGDDATLQEGLKTVSAALSRALPSPQRPIANIAQTTTLPRNDDESVSDEAEYSEVVEEPSPTSTNIKAARRSKARSPVILDLQLSGDDPLADFMNQYAPEAVNKRYLLAAYWLKKYHQIAEVSMDHIHTCFRHMNWPTPKDAVQPLRVLKSKEEWFDKGDEQGHYKINHIGENVVMKIMENNE
ncbi:hypothetical protein [Schlesneria paludicola]|uniref:hypothetical protein n=1 Tax=Schlesneria paludicola TaxID=360056 RepID=UPI00029AC1BE|nr:hypothetical protein [Schlesneria paludicola]